MLTGRLPFEAESFTGVLAMHMYMEPPSPSSIVGVPLGGVEDIVKKCMAKKPSDRYATMLDLLSDLDRAGALLSVPPEPSSRRRLDEPTSGEISLAVEPTPRRFGGRALAASLLLGGRGGEPVAPSLAVSAAPAGLAAPAAAPSAEHATPEPEPSASALPPEDRPAPQTPRPQPKASAPLGVKSPSPAVKLKPVRTKAGEIIDPWGR
jgi:serine/threonine protein kinase